MPSAEPSRVKGLLDRYARQQPRRAQGGLANLAGLDFQLRCYLAAFVEEMASSSAVAPAGARFLEALSDLSLVSDDAVACVQVKRTLTRASLAKAAEEAVALDEFLEREAPDLHAAFRFEVVGLLGRADGFAPGWEGVQLPHDAEGREARQARFERMLAQGKLAPPRLEPDPWWRVIAAAWPVLDEPFAFAREALDICLRRGLDPSGAERTRDEVAEAFARRRRDAGLMGMCLRPEDVAADAHQSRETVLGQRPTLAHLRDGRFMERPERVDAALAELDRHVAERDLRQEPYIHALWIEGRSGNGKSVLLLKAMRRLVEERAAPVIWLDDASEQLLPLLQTWARLPEGSMGLCYVFVDDFYSPNKRADIGLPEIARLLRRKDRSDWPVLVTCGPPEQRLEWAASGQDEVFRVAHWLLPPAEADEREGLRGWFRERTGVERRAGAAFGENDGLMISMMFEMREGDMVEFGRRFHQRLSDLNLVDSIIQPLALNRLYIWAPGRWLDESQSDALRRLNQDRDFSFLSFRGRPDTYIRITHPHLSDGIYNAVRSRADGIVRARDLHRAFERSLDTDPTVAHLVLERVARQHERLASLDEGELARGMAAAWRAWLARGGAAGFHAAPMWTNWAVWSARQPEVAALLGEAPSEHAARALHEGHPYWSTLWERLATLPPEAMGPATRARLLERGHRWLRGNEARPEWTFVWRLLVDSPPESLPAGIGRSDLLLQGLGWLAGREDRPEFPYVWRRLVELRDALPDAAALDGVLRRGEGWLAGHEDRFAWSRIWEALLDLRAQAAPERARLLRQGREWLAGREERPEWNFVWKRLLDLRAELPPGEGDDLAREGRLWLVGREESAQWPHVWQKLLETDLPADVPRRDLLLLGLGWLQGRADRPEWSFVWRRLVEARRELSGGDALLIEGQAWLSGREGNPAWSFVWQALAQERQGLPATGSTALLEEGFRWLQGREERPEWAYVLQALVDLGPDLPPGIPLSHLVEAALGWAAKRRARPDWWPLWRKVADGCALLPPGPLRDAVLAEGSQWLAEHQDRPEWCFVWQRLVDLQAKIAPEADLGPILRQGLARLRGGEDRPEWTHVWRTLVDLRAHMPDQAQVAPLLESGHRWLAGREERPGWGFVWQRLVWLRDELPPSIPLDDLLLKGREWLSGREGDRSWSYVWESLADVGRERHGEAEFSRLLVLGHGWLPGNEDRPDWSYIWRKLRRGSADLPGTLDHDALLATGRRWLCDGPPRGEWPLVWLSHHKDKATGPEDRAFLGDLAWAWLQRPESRARPEWTQVWRTCCRAGRRDPAFMEAGWARLLAHPDAVEAPMLAGELVSASRKPGAWAPPADLRAWTHAWLRANPDNPSWAPLWRALWGAERSEASARLALEWLAGGAAPGRTGSVVKRLCREPPPDVRAMLEAWLALHPESPFAAPLREALEQPAPQA